MVSVPPTKDEKNPFLCFNGLNFISNFWVCYICIPGTVFVMMLPAAVENPFVSSIFFLSELCSLVWQLDCILFRFFGFLSDNIFRLPGGICCNPGIIFVTGFLLLVQLINILEKVWIEGCFPVSVYVPVLCTMHQWLAGRRRQKGFWGCRWAPDWPKASNGPLWQQRIAACWAALGKALPQLKEVILVIALSSAETHLQIWVQFWVFQSKTQTYKSKPHEGPWRWVRAWFISQTWKGWENLPCLFWRRGALVRSVLLLPFPQNWKTNSRSF